MTPSCFVCERAMRLIHGSYTWKCYYRDVLEEHEAYHPRVRTVKEASCEAFGSIVYIDHAEQQISSPGLYPLVRGAVAGCQEKFCQAFDNQWQLC